MSKQKHTQENGSGQTSELDNRSIGLQSAAVYQIIRRDGEEELARPLVSLWWSGLAAGLAISMSVVAEAALHQHLPEAEWTPLVSSLGYSVGFLIVVLGRLQLFTENTITVILPLLAAPSRRQFWLTAQLWAVVLTANLVGTLLAAAVSHYGGLASDAQIAAIRAISQPILDKSFSDALLAGIPAGFLIAAMVWMLPSSSRFEFWTVLLMTYVIGVGGFSHVIAGSTEAFLLIFLGDIGPLGGIGGYILPALIGNVIGGTGLFALLAYAQVKEEI